MTFRPALPGAGVATLLARWGMHDAGFAMLYAPNPVQPGSSVSHWDASAWPDLLMEPFTSVDVFDQVDLRPAQFRDVGHTITGFDEIFSDGFESEDRLGDRSSTTLPSVIQGHNARSRSGPSISIWAPVVMSLPMMAKTGEPGVQVPRATA